MTYKDVWHVPPVLPNKMQKAYQYEGGPLEEAKEEADPTGVDFCSRACIR
jgi:hypothetical protein